ncbi:MAG: hypothetical protein IAF94_09405 [Pirellulaceae bacterium]|nr:hypothetical protein [Pirellulaceae bacterium]
MDDDRNRGGMAGPILTVGTILLFLPLLYILSCGPAVALMTRGYLSEEAFAVAYYPLSLAARSSTWIGQILESYANLWAA